MTQARLRLKVDATKLKAPQYSKKWRTKRMIGISSPLLRLHYYNRYLWSLVCKYLRCPWLQPHIESASPHLVCRTLILHACQQLGDGKSIRPRGTLCISSLNLSPAFLITKVHNDK